MVFSSISFIFVFLPLFFAVYALVPQRAKNSVLFAGSLIFYALGDAGYTLLLFACVCVNYIISKKIASSEGRKKRVFLTLGLLYDFGLLVYFKYADFLMENISVIFSQFGHTLSYEPMNLLLPLGISFYTFQISSYLMDVYDKKTEAAPSVVHLGAYLCMFPQLIAGPIVEYKEVSQELKNRTVTPEKADTGMKIFTLGLAFKVLLANVLSGIWSEMERIGFDSISTPMAWLGMYGYSMQLYFDFFGYSLMAIGLGKMLGFTIPQNFRQPYMSRSVSEFWRRWHITLGRWFRSYIYIPLGGNRMGKLKTLRNLLIVWFLTGVWHGADWNYVIWGLVLFFWIAMERIFLGKILERHRIFSHLYVLLIIPLTWMIFKIEDLNTLQVYFMALFPFLRDMPQGVVHGQDWWMVLQNYWPVLLFCVIFCLEKTESCLEKWMHKKWFTVLLCIVFWACVYRLFTAKNNPFLYFRF